MRLRKFVMGMCSTVVFGLAGCGTTGPADTGTYANVSGYGTVQSVEIIDRRSNNVLGTVGGAVVGGLLGHQIGGGSGNTAATLAGAAGGAYAGNRVQQNMNRGESGQSYRIAVRMDDGAIQTLRQDAPPAVQSGDRVRIQNGAIVQRLR